MLSIYSGAAKRFKKSSIVIFVTILVVGLSRHLPLVHPELLNFSPVLAIFMLSGAYLKGNLSWIAPLIGVIVSDILINPSYGANLFESFMLVTLFSYSLIFLLGKMLGNKIRIRTLAFAGIGSALTFHFITCGFVWWVNPFYTKDIGGFIQATIIGDPQYHPFAYVFLRNSILSTVLFSVVFGIAFRLQSNLKASKKLKVA